MEGMKLIIGALFMATLNYSIVLHVNPEEQIAMATAILTGTIVVWCRK